MTETYDVIVIGGGPAGSTAAGFLAQSGARVLLLEKERFPRYHIGESLLSATLPILEALGVMPAIEQAGFIRKPGGTFIWGRGNKPWSFFFREDPGGRPHAFHVLRSEFDHILLRHAASLGVEVREGHRVQEVGYDGHNRVVAVDEHGAEVAAEADAAQERALARRKCTLEEAVAEAQRSTRALVTMAVVPNTAPHRYGGVLMEAGGEVIGVIIPSMNTKSLAHDGLTRMEVPLTMHARKAKMHELADGKRPAQHAHVQVYAQDHHVLSKSWFLACSLFENKIQENLNAWQSLFPLSLGHLGVPTAGSHKDRLETLFQEGFHGEISSQPLIGLRLHACVQNAIDFPVKDVLGQTVLRKTCAEQASESRRSFIDHRLMAQAIDEICRCQTLGAPADDGGLAGLAWVSLPDMGGPAIFIANEFFDALPVSQAVKTESGWHERQIEVDSTSSDSCVYFDPDGMQAAGPIDFRMAACDRTVVEPFGGTDTITGATADPMTR